MLSLQLPCALGFIWAVLITPAVRTNRQRLGPLKVACVGDSITFGYRGWAPASEHAYPRMLQAILGKDYNVTNLGNAGKTMQKAGVDKWGPAKLVPSSWWDTEQYKTLTSSKWDVVVIALGTNDAKDESVDGPPNWKHEACDERPYSASCPYWVDYTSMIQLVRNLGTFKEYSPDIYLVIPPPVMKHGAFSINQKVVNSVMPGLIRSIAAANGIPENNVLDMFSALGGNSLRDVPPSGCTPEMSSTISGCGFFCDDKFCDQVHPDDSGFMAMAALAGSSISSKSQTLQSAQ